MSDDRVSKNEVNEGGDEDIMEGMARKGSADGDLEIDSLYAEEDDVSILVSEDGEEAVRDRYKVEGRPDFFKFSVKHSTTLEDMSITETQNDIFLNKITPSNFIGMSIKTQYDKRKKYKKVSAFSKKSYDYNGFSKQHMPLNGITEGGKGLTNLSRSVVYTTAVMSGLLNVSLSHGCSAQCSFCFPVDSRHNYVENPEGGFQPLSQIKVGDKIMSPTRGKFVEVLSKNLKGKKEVFQYNIGESTLECTGDHPVLSSKNGKFVIIPIGECFSKNLPLFVLS